MRIASSSAADSFAAQSASLELAKGAKKPLVGSIGEQTSESLVEHGMEPDFKAAKPRLESLIEAQIERLKG